MRKITPEKLALNLWAKIIGGLIGDMDNEIKFIKERKEDYGFTNDDVDRAFKELVLLYVFLVEKAVLHTFPEKNSGEIIKEFERIIEEEIKLKEHYKYWLLLLEGVVEYAKVYNTPFEMKKEIDDESLLNNPYYRIAKHASIKCFGEKEGMDVRKIIFFNSGLTHVHIKIQEYIDQFEVI